MKEVTDDMLKRVIADAVSLAARAGISGKAAVRRVLGTSEWRHDDERMKAAAAKRERRLKRAGGASL